MNFRFVSPYLLLLFLVPGAALTGCSHPATKAGADSRALANAQVDTRASVPRLYIGYSQVFDWKCSIHTQTQLNPKWQFRADALAKSMQKRIDKDGTRLFEEILRLIKKPFPRHEDSVTFSVCERSFSASEPLILQVLDFINGPSDQPKSEDILLSQIQHEFLHAYVNSILDPWNRSEFVRKHRAEIPSRDPVVIDEVISHLHLFALLKESYIRMGSADLLAQVKADNVRFGGGYKIAWDLVDQYPHDELIIELAK